jgi:hypothetical protein
MERGYIDIYCERTGPEFWSEPANAVTNLAFLIAAAALVRLLCRDAGENRAIGWFLTGMIAVIGIGSGLFHTFAQRWAALADVIPIAIFILAYTWFALRRFVGLPRWACWAGPAAVLGIAAAVPALTGFRGGSYIAALIAMTAIGGWLVAVPRHPAGRALLAAAAVFVVSLTFRTIDEPLCGDFPLGTHFMWHILNAIVLYLVARAMIRQGQRADA